MHDPTLRSGVLALGAAMLLAGSATAQFHDGHYTGAYDFDVEFPGMLDFDQVRAASGKTPGLPGDGEMYCVPTSTMNLFAYLANHGYSSLAPGPGDWEDHERSDLYDAITGHIDDLGALMGTSTEDGTTLGEWHTGTTAWLRGVRGGDFGFKRLVAESYYVGDGYTTTADRLASYGTNGVVGFCYGFYPGEYSSLVTRVDSETGQSWYEGTIDERLGGHCVSLYSAARTSETVESRVDVMDPDHSVEWNSSTDQSKMEARQWYTDDVEFTDEGYFTSVLKDTGRAELSVIDGIFVIRPVWVLTTSADFPDLIRILQLMRSGEPETERNIALSGPVREAVMRPDQLFAAAVTRGRRSDPASLWLVEVAAGEASQILQGGELRLAFSRFLELYVANDTSLVRYAVDDGTARPLGSVELGFRPRAIEWMDGRDELLVLDGDRGSLFALPRQLDAPPREIADNELLADLASDPKARMAAVPEGGVAVLSPQRGIVALFQEEGNRLRTVARYDEAHGATDLTSDDRGFVALAGADGRLTWLAQAGFGELRPVDETATAHVATGGVLELARSRSNWDPERHSGPGWRNGRAR